MSTMIDHRGIASVISNMRLAVPTHQRPFEWTSEEISELITDIDGAFNRNREEYFLGSVVVIAPKDAERHQVLDGQQRLATVTLLLASIADAFEGKGESEAATAVRQASASYDIDSGISSPHVRLNQDDDPYFRALLKAEYNPPEPGSPRSHQLLYEAREQVKKWVASKSYMPAGVQWLKDTWKYLRDAVRVIYFSVPDDANAYLIFETLNDRGLDLSIADLLKNYLLGRSGDQVATVLALWTKTRDTLKTFGYEDSFTMFLRHYWASKFDVVREKDLYRKIKDRLTSAALVIEFATDLATNAYYYTALVSPEHEYWSGLTTDGRERLRALAILGLEQYRPMLLAALARFPVVEVERTLRLLESWNVRLVIVGGVGGGYMETKYAELGRAIRSGSIKNVIELADRSVNFVPTDAALVQAFKVATISKVALARYYLRQLEVTASPGSAERVPNPSLTLEHILPEKPGANYPAFKGEEQRALFIRRLGNLALLTHKMNSELKSAAFDRKVDVYRASELMLARSVSEYEAWTPKEIEARQATLADLAPKTWPLKP